MDINTQDLRASLAALPTSGRGRRYTPDLRDQVNTAVRSARDAGQTWDAIAGELGLPAITLKRWVEPVAVAREVVGVQIGVVAGGRIGVARLPPNGPTRRSQRLPAIVLDDAIPRPRLRPRLLR